MKAYNKIFAALSVFGLITADNTAFANASANALVSVNVPKKCSISASALNFGSYDPFGAHAAADLDATSTIGVACSKSAVVDIGISQGSTPDVGSTADVPLRQMANGTERLRYDLYADNAHSTVWGDETGTATQSYTSGSKNTVTSLTVFGRIPRNQDIADGSYQDQITATVLF